MSDYVAIYVLIGVVYAVYFAFTKATVEPPNVVKKLIAVFVVLPVWPLYAVAFFITSLSKFKVEKICAWCGHIYLTNEKARQHVFECKKHPLRRDIECKDRMISMWVSLAKNLDAELSKSKGWISVDDRLPDEDVRVMVAQTVKVSDLYGYWQDVTTGTRVDYGRGIDWTDDWSDTLHGVTHWMPLPPNPEAPND